LHALVTRDSESQLTEMWEQHEGKIRDRVIRICRRASYEDLQEAELATLKSHLMDAVQAQLGPKVVRRLLMTEVDIREL
jgi:flagellar basal body-associated protein FliL